MAAAARNIAAAHDDAEHCAEKPTPLEALEMLERVVRAAERGELADCQEAATLGAGLRAYRAKNADGLTLERALGIAPGAGGLSWRTEERFRVRDEAIRSIYKNRYAHLSIAQAALEIEKLGLRYQTTAGRADRQHHTRPAPGGDVALISRAVSSGVGFPKHDQIENILKKGINSPLLIPRMASEIENRSEPAAPRNEDPR